MSKRWNPDKWPHSAVYVPAMHRGELLEIHALRARLYRLQRARCFICTKHMPDNPHTPSHVNGWTIEHVIPSRHGSLPYNIVLAHKGCNLTKGHRDPTLEDVIRCAVLYEQLLTQLNGRNKTGKGWIKQNVERTETHAQRD